MEMPKKLKDRVRKELAEKLVMGNMSRAPTSPALIAENVEKRIKEIEAWLDESVDLEEFEEFVREDSPELQVALAISEISDPELAATVEAAWNGTLDVEGITADINDGFEASFHHFCGEHGLKRRTTELLLAYRQEQTAANS